MEYRKNIYQQYSDERIAEIQSMLNRARSNAYLLLKADASLPSMLGNPHYFQTLHHRNYVPSNWLEIKVDGFFGNKTEMAVKCFQEFLYITINGIVGNTTYSFLNTLSSYNSGTIKILGSNVSLSKPQNSIKDDVLKWRENFYLTASFYAFFDLASVVAVSPTTIWISWENIWNHFISSVFSEIPVAGLENGMVIAQTPRSIKGSPILWVNQGNRPATGRGNYTAIRIGVLKKYSNVIDSFKKALEPLGKIIDAGMNAMSAINVVCVAFESCTSVHKYVKGEIKFIDLIGDLKGDLAEQGKNLADLADPLHDILIKGSSIAQKIPIQKATHNLGKTIAKTKFVSVISKAGGISAASVGASAAVGLVGLQCVGAFLTGCEIGKFLEEKTHLGEKTVNWLWGAFIGDLVQPFIDMKVNRVVCVQYPPGWSDEDIQKFHESLGKGN